MSSTPSFIPLRLRAYLRHPKVRAAWISFFWGVVLFYFCFCALILATRWVLLPQVDKYKDDIAAFLSESLHAEVTIGRVSPRWDTFWPQLSLADVQIRRPDPRAADEHVLHLPQVYASFYWRSVLGEPIFRRLEVSDAEITVRHVGENVFDIAGFVFDFNRAGADESDGSARAADWLLKQGRIDFRNGTVSYVDLIAEPRPRTTAFENINFTFARGVSDYRAAVQGAFKSRHENRIDVRTRFEAPLLGERGVRTWTGELYVSADNLDVARLMRPIPAVRGLLNSGRGSTRTWLTFDEGRITDLTSYLGLSDVVLRFARDTEPLRVRTLATKLTQTFAGDLMNVRLENLGFEMTDGTKAEGLDLETAVTLADEESSRTGFSIRRLEMTTLEKLLPSMPFPQEAARLIRDHDAGGSISDFEVSWTGLPGSARDWRIRTKFANLSIEHVAETAPSSVFTGFENLTGELEVSRNEGRIRFETAKGAVTLPAVFENARVPLDALTGTVRWKKAPDKALGREALSVTFEDITFANEDAAGTVKGFWRESDSKAGYIDLTGTIGRARADRAWRYMPLVIAKPVRNWLQAGLAAGTASGGTFDLRGELSQYPWTGANKDKGLFRIAGRIQDGAIDYLPSMKTLADGSFERGATWPLLTDINGTILFEGASMVVQAQSAATGGAVVRDARAEIPNLAAHENTRLLVKGKADSNLQNFFDYAQKSPVGGFTAHAFDDTKAKGTGSLDLSLDIPLLHPADTKVNGALTLDASSIEMGWPKPPLTDVEGTVRFSEKGAWASGLNARVFGSGDAAASVNTGANGAIIISVSGKTDVSGLKWLAQTPYLEPVVDRMKGTMPFVTNVMIKKGAGVTVTARSSLKGVSVDLPAPLAKEADSTWDTTFSLTPVNLRDGAGYLVSAGSGNRFDVTLQLPRDGSKAAARGAVAVGSRASLPAEGLAVNAQASRVRLLDWQPFMQEMLKKAGSAGSVSGQASSLYLSGVEVKAGELILEDGTLKDARSLITFDRSRNIDIELDSNGIKGKLRYEPEGRGSVTGSFERLHLSPKFPDTLKRFLQGERVALVPEARPTVLPSLDLVAEDLRYDNRRIGKMVLQAQASGTAEEETLRITNFAVFSETSALTGKGSWTQGRRLVGEHSGSTDFGLSFSTRNLGQTLADLGYGGVIEDSTGTATGRVSFKGVPWSPQVDTISGTYTIDLRKGSFAKVDTGAGGLLLSFLSMQSLFKRLTLDFSDFKGGFAFDSLTASSDIKNGILSNDNTKIVGTHGTILLTGSMNLMEGNIDSRVIVLPEINAGNASLALAFVNPAVGIGSFLAQLLLRTPLSHLFKVEYTIKGPWSDPVITKVEGGEEKID